MTILCKTLICCLFSSAAPVSWDLPQAQGQDPHNLPHPWYQTSQDEPGAPQWCMKLFFHNLYFYIYIFFYFYSCSMEELNNMFNQSHLFVPFHSSCATERSITTAEASWSLCPSLPSWCTATTSMRSAVRYGKHRWVWHRLLENQLKS